MRSDIRGRRTPVEADPARMCEKLVGLREVAFVGIDDVEQGPPTMLIR